VTSDEQQHLCDLYDALYQGLGVAAPTFTTDALVIRAHELARLFGEQALALRGERPGTPNAPVLGMLDHAAAYDDSGALALFAVTMLLSPRLLIWLRDLDEVAPDPVIAAGQHLLVTSMNETGRVLARLAPVMDDIEGVVQSYLVELDAQGWGEHLGPR